VYIFFFGGGGGLIIKENLTEFLYFIQHTMSLRQVTLWGVGFERELG
jgi:hypothetical protein